MRKLMQNKDAREVLQEEINESVLRLKKAKFGHQLGEIVPQHENSFYLPDKGKYIHEKKPATSNGVMNSSQSNYSASKSMVASQKKFPQRSISNVQGAYGSPGVNPRASSINDVSSMFMTEPPSMLKQPLFGAGSQLRNTQFGNKVNISALMRGSGQSTHDDT